MIRILLGCSAALLLNGCAGALLNAGAGGNSGAGYQAGCQVDQRADMVRASERVAAELLQTARSPVATNQIIIAATLVNIDDLQDTSSFGRMLAEQIGAAFTREQYSVVEMKLRQNDILVQERGGEFVLSRELKQLSLDHEAQAIILGTYVVAENEVLVSAKLVSPYDNIAISAFSFGLPLDVNIRRLLELPPCNTFTPTTDRDWVDRI